MKKPLNALDRAFLTSESRDVMMHVGALMTFVPPKKKSDLIAQLRDELARDVDVQRPWTLKLQHPDLLASPVQSWIDDEHFELDYHVRRSALPSPGDEREGGRVDFSRAERGSAQ